MTSCFGFSMYKNNHNNHLEKSKDYGDDAKKRVLANGTYSCVNNTLTTKWNEKANVIFLHSDADNRQEYRAQVYCSLLL